MISVNLILFGKLQERNVIVQRHHDFSTNGIWVQSSDSKYNPSMYAYLYIDPMMDSPVIALHKREEGKTFNADNLAFFVRKGEPHMQIVKDGRAKIVPLWEMTERLGY